MHVEKYNCSETYEDNVVVPVLPPLLVPRFSIIYKVPDTIFMIKERPLFQLVVKH